MGFREEQKRQREKVSAILMEGALQLSAEEGYASLSLRSVARKAGIAPTSFYRHFRDMDELGLALVDKAADLFLDGLEEATEKMDFSKPKASEKPDKISQALKEFVTPFVEFFFILVSENENLYRLFFQERTGSSSALRRAIRKAIKRSARVIEYRMRDLDLKFRSKEDTARTMALAILNLAISAGLEMLTDEELSPPETAKMVERECTLLLLGATVA